MIIIYIKHLLPKDFYAINICGVILAKSQYKPLDECSIRHEAIHSKQIFELLIIIFYLWYLIEWFYRVIQYRNFHKAYRNIAFEREAYDNQYNESYLTTRKRFSFWKYLKDTPS